MVTCKGLQGSAGVGMGKFVLKLPIGNRKAKKLASVGAITSKSGGGGGGGRELSKGLLSKVCAVAD